MSLKCCTNMLKIIYKAFFLKIKNVNDDVAITLTMLCCNYFNNAVMTCIVEFQVFPETSPDISYGLHTKIKNKNLKHLKPD